MKNPGQFQRIICHGKSSSEILQSLFFFGGWDPAYFRIPWQFSHAHSNVMFQIYLFSFLIFYRRQISRLQICPGNQIVNHCEAFLLQGKHFFRTRFKSGFYMLGEPGKFKANSKFVFFILKFVISGINIFGNFIFFWEIQISTIFIFREFFVSVIIFSAF